MSSNETPPGGSGDGKAPPAGFFRRLGAARREQPIEFASLVVSTTALGIGVATLIFVFVQLDRVRNSLDSQAYSHIINNLLELDKIFIAHPEYRKYFQDGAPLPEGDPAAMQKIWALADLKLDGIDAFHSQATHVDSSRYTRDAWDEYHRWAFNRSPVLCRAICNDWAEYGTTMRSIALKECGPKLKQRNPQTARDGCEWVP